MISPRVFGIATGALVLLCVGLGLWVVGGPGQARLDRFDQMRLQDLSRLAQVLRCEGHADRVLPEELSAEILLEHCPEWAPVQVNLQDAETGAAYVYERVSDREVRICAEFHDPDPRREGHILPLVSSAFDPATGCITVRR